MDKEKTKDLIKILQAFFEGETVEQRAVISDNYQSSWFTHTGDDWNTNKFEYRIKPKPQYRPFKDIDECWAEMKNHQPFGWIKTGGHYKNIVELNKNNRVFINNDYNSNYNWKEMCQDTTFADGTPFGMKVTDNCPMLRKAPK